MKIFQFVISTTHKRDEQFLFHDGVKIDFKRYIHCSFFFFSSYTTEISVYNIYPISTVLPQVW